MNKGKTPTVYLVDSENVNDVWIKLVTNMDAGDEILVSNGFNNGKLRHLLVQFGIVKKSEDIDEPINDESGKKESRYHLSYKVPKKNFKDKIRKLYHSEKLDEINLHGS